MYLKHYGLKDKPFKLAHDPAYYYPAAHQIPLNELLYSIEEQQGLATLIGEPGTGKTTLLRRILQSLDDRYHGILLTDAHLGGSSIFRRLESAVGAPPATEQTGSEQFRKRLTRIGKTVVLLLDEAQNLAVDQLQELQYLTNLEAQGRKLIEIIVAGQPVLETKLTAPILAALCQRAVVRCRLEPLDFPHTRSYITHRLTVAGARGSTIFTPAAVQLIYKRSRGVPRLINVLCERCLIVGYVGEVKTIDEALVKEGAKDLHWDAETGQPAPPPQHGGNSNLLPKIAARIEAIEKKISMLIYLTARSAEVPRAAAEAIQAKRWVESLKTGPQIFPAAKNPPVVAQEASARLWINSLKRPPNGQTGRRRLRDA